jgi:hypothetical protein
VQAGPASAAGKTNRMPEFFLCALLSMIGLIVWLLYLDQRRLERIKDEILQISMMNNLRELDLLPQTLDSPFLVD